MAKITVAELINKLGFEVDNAQLKATTNKVDQASASMKRMLIGVGAGFAAAFGVKKILAATSEMESLTSSFETLTGSQANAAKLMQDINKFAILTPFTLQGLGDAARTLKTFGIETSKVVPTLQMLGDVAGADEQKLGSLAMSFAQVQSFGKLMGVQYLQMVRTGFNPLSEIAKKTGESQEALQKRMAAGKITAKEVEDAFKRATSAGGTFYGGTLRQSQTLQGRWSTFTDNIEAALRNIGGGILDQLKESLDKMIDFTNNALDTLTATIGEAMAPLLQIGGDILQLGMVFASVLTDDILGVARMTGEGLQGLADRLREWMATNAEQIVAAMRKASAAVRWVYLAFVALVDILGGPVATVLRFLYRNMEAIVAVLVVFRTRTWLLVYAQGGLASALTASSGALVAQVKAFAAANKSMLALTATASVLVWAYDRIKQAIGEVEEARRKEAIWAKEQERADLKIAVAVQKKQLAELEAKGKGQSSLATQIRKSLEDDIRKLAEVEREVNANRARESGVMTGLMSDQFEDMLRKQSDALKSTQSAINNDQRNYNINTEINVDGAGGADIGKAIAAHFSLQLQRVLASTI